MRPESKYIIYGLVDPRTRLVRYVGKSVRGLARPKSHRHPSNRKKRTHTATWVRSLISEGADYEIVILEQCEREILSAAEIWWIAYGRACNWSLTNHTDGGEGVLGLKFSAESRAKMSASHKGYVPTEEARARMSAAGLGRVFTAEQRAQISRAKTGQTHSPEARAMMRAAKAGKPGRVQSPEEIEKRRQSLFGNKRALGHTKSPETRARMSESRRRGRTVSAEARERIAAARRGKPTRESAYETTRPKVRINLLGGT